MLNIPEDILLSLHIVALIAEKKNQDSRKARKRLGDQRVKSRLELHMDDSRICVSGSEARTGQVIQLLWA